MILIPLQLGDCQSINQSIKQPINQSIKETVCRDTRATVHLFIHLLGMRSVGFFWDTDAGM